VGNHRVGGSQSDKRHPDWGGINRVRPSYPRSGAQAVKRSSSHEELNEWNGGFGDWQSSARGPTGVLHKDEGLYSHRWVITKNIDFDTQAFSGVFETCPYEHEVFTDFQHHGRKQRLR
jgi:hypothetical protein